MLCPHGGVGAPGIGGGCSGGPSDGAGVAPNGAGVFPNGAGVPPNGEGVAHELEEPSVRSSASPGGAEGLGARSTAVTASEGKVRDPGKDSTETAGPEWVHEGRGGGGRGGAPGGGGRTGSPRIGVSNLGGSAGSGERGGGSTAKRLMRSGILSGSL
jgi:hypothetical protein